MSRHWSFGIHYPDGTKEPEYFVKWGTEFRRPLVYLTFPTFDAASWVGGMLMEADKGRAIPEEGPW